MSVAVPYIVDDGKIWAQFDHYQVVVGVDVNATKGPDVDNPGEVRSVNQNERKTYGFLIANYPHDIPSTRNPGSCF